MIDWFADNLSLIMFCAMFIVIFCGFPVAFVMGGMAIVFAVLGWAVDVFPIVTISNILLQRVL